MNKIYLNVPFYEKEFAKKYGARWNPERKRWYVTDSIPSELEIYCAIYQGNAIIPHIPDPQVIADIMVTIVDHDKTLNEYMAVEMM